MLLLLLAASVTSQVNSGNLLHNDEINEVIQKALVDADSKKNRNNEEFEKEMLPGTYVIGQWIIELAHPLTGPTTREIQGYSTSQNYYAIVVDKSKIYDSATVITDPVKQKYYILEEEIRKVELESDMTNGREIRVFNKKEIDKMQVFTRVQMRSRFEVKANEQDELCEIGLSGVDCTKSFSFNWDETNDQPKLKELLNGQLQAGVGVISSFTFDVDMDLYWIGFYLKAEIGARLEAGALIEIPAEIEIGSVPLFEQAFNLLNGLTSLSLFGTSIGLTLKIGVSASINDIKITFGKPIRYYKGYEITVSKVYTLSSETGFEQSKWITSVNPKNDEFNLESAVSNLLTEIMLRASPTLSLSLTLGVEWGTPFASIGVSLDFSVPMSFGLDYATCSMPYVAGSIGLSLDAVLNIPKIKMRKFTIFDGYKQSYNIFSVDSGTMCLYDPKLNIEEDDDSYISTTFDTDNLIYCECTAGSSSVNLNFIVQADTDEGSIKRDLVYLQLKPNKNAQFGHITLDKSLDPKITVSIQKWGTGGSVETIQIFTKNLGEIGETEYISSSELAGCSLKLIKIRSKDVDFGKYIDQDTNVNAITFKAKTSSTSIGEKYIPISFNDKITVQETYYYPVYQNHLLSYSPYYGKFSAPDTVYKVKIVSINTNQQLDRIIMTTFNDGKNPFFSVNLKGKPAGNQNLKNLGINPNTEYFITGYSIDAQFVDTSLYGSSKILQLNKEITGNHELSTSYGVITINVESVNEFDVTLLYSQPKSMMIGRYLEGKYLPPIVEDTDVSFDKKVHISSPNNLEKLQSDVKYVVLGIDFSDSFNDGANAMPSDYNGYIVLNVPGWTVLSEESTEINDGIFIVYINSNVGNHIISDDGNYVYIPMRRKKVITDSEEYIYAYGPYKLNSKGSPFCDPTAYYTFKQNDYSRLGCISGNDEYSFIDQDGEINSEYQITFNICENLKIIQNFPYIHQSYGQATVAAYQSHFDIPTKNTQTTFSMATDIVSEFGKKVQINVLSTDTENDLLCMQNDQIISPTSQGKYEIDPTIGFTFHKMCTSDEQAFCYQTMDLKGGHSGKWFTVITYPDASGIIPVEPNSELGRGFKYDIVANHENVYFSKISVGLISTKIYSSSSIISSNLKINIQKGSVVRSPLRYFKSNKSMKAEYDGNPLFYTNICYTLGEDRIPVKRSLYISNPTHYAVQMGFNVREADFNPDNIELDSNGCLSVYEYKLEAPNDAKILELTGISDFVKEAEVSVTGEYETLMTLPDPEIPDYSHGENDGNITANDENITANDSSSGNGPNDNNTDEPKSNAAVIAGSVVAVIVVLGVVVGLLVFFLVIKKKKERSTSSNNEIQNDEV